MSRVLAALAACALLAPVPQARSDWPQFLGPSRDGSAKAEIPEHATLHVSWRTPLLAGHSGIVTNGATLFTLGSDGDRDFLIALDAATGGARWQTPLGVSVGGNEPSSTPALAGDMVIAVDSSCAVVAARTSDGSIAWRRSLAEEYKSRFAPAGCGMSPLVIGTRVIVPTGAREGARLVSFDLATGATQWTADTLLNSLNGAPGVATIAGSPVVLYHSGKPPGIGGVSAVDPETGAELWHVDMPEGISDTAPVLTPRGLLLHGWSGSTMFGSPTGRAAPAALWSSKELTAQWAPSVLHGSHLYGFGGNSGDFMLCVDAATGATKWSERTYRGHVARAGSTLVVLSESSGLLRLIAADPARYRELRRLEVLKPGARTRTPPSIAGRMIFVRNLEEVVAIEIR